MVRIVFFIAVLILLYLIVLAPGDAEGLAKCQELHSFGTCAYTLR